MIDLGGKHIVRANVQLVVAVHRLIDDQPLTGLRMLSRTNDEVGLPFKVTIKPRLDFSHYKSPSLDRSFKVVSRLHLFYNLNRIPDILNDTLDPLVGKRAFVQSALVNRGGIDPLHRLSIVLHRDGLLSLSSGEDSSSTVRCGIVPVAVSLTDADESAIPHVDGDDELLALVGRDSPLAEDAMLYINVVVDALKLLLYSPAHMPNDLLGNIGSVQLGIFLDDIWTAIIFVESENAPKV